MLANYELLLEFLGEFQSAGGCAKGSKTVAINTIYLGSSLSKHAFNIQEMVVPV